MLININSNPQIHVPSYGCDPRDSTPGLSKLEHLIFKYLRAVPKNIHTSTEGIGISWGWGVYLEMYEA